MTDTNPAFTDEALTAYLDGEADAALRAQIDAALQGRLEALSLPEGAVSRAFDLGAIAAPSYPKGLGAEPAPKTSKIIWPAAIAASFVLGMAVMQALQPEPRQPGWVDVVASYQSLYVTETLEGMAQPEAVSREILAEAETLLGVSLEAALQIDGLEFKRVQRLALGDTPLYQMAYLDAEGRPFAFCLTPVSAESRGMATKTSWQLAQSSWVEDGVGFVLIGGEDEARVARLSEGLRGRL